jgi:hypothetical protein
MVRGWTGGVPREKPLSCSAKDLARAKSKASLSPPQGGRWLRG